MKHLLTILAILFTLTIQAQWSYSGNRYWTPNGNIASADYSTAMGHFTLAGGFNSTAMGFQTKAIGPAGTAMGVGTTASGLSSTAMGVNTIASDMASTVIGHFNLLGSTPTSDIIYNELSPAFVIGNGIFETNGNINRSDAFSVLFNGNTTIGGSLTLNSTEITATGTELNYVDGVTSSIQTQLDSKISAGLVSVTENSNTGYRLASANASNHGDIGFNAVDLSSSISASTTRGATGAYSIALGGNSTASGNASVAMGNNTEASGNASVAMGDDTTASGEYSTAIGRSTVASGDYSTAIGRSTVASGDYSTAMGVFITASGWASTAMGNSTTASDCSSTVIGQYNSSGSTATSATSFSTLAPAFVIGNGIFDTNGNINRSDAFSVLFNGTTTIAGNVTAPAFIGDGSQLTNLPNQNTDDQAISYDTTTNIVSLEDGGIIDLGLLNNSGTDDQALNLTGNTLDLEDGGSVNLVGYLDNTDDQAISYDTTTNIVSLEDGGTIDLGLLNNSGTDDQALNLTGNTLDLEDGGSVNLAGYLDNTDDQAISYDTTTNIVSLEDGGTIDLGLLNNSGTDDQALNLTGNTLDLEDGGSVNLAGYLDNTDDQAISYDTTTNIVSLEDGGTIDLGLLNNSGTDDQQLANFILSAGSLLSLSIQDGNVVSVNLAPLLADLEAENAQQQAQIDEQQALIDDLIIRMEIREECACDPTLGLGDNTLQPDKAYLLQNIPNPFDRSTSIGYFVPYTNATAHIVISTMAGQIVHNVELSNLGVGAVSIDSGRMAAAMYLYTLYVDGKRIDTKRMIIE